MSSIKTSPFSAEMGIHSNSDIASLAFDGRELTITLACMRVLSKEIRGLRVCFERASAFRYLDESELSRYWISNEFTRGHLVLEVHAGGWNAEESQVQGIFTQKREWLIVTGNGCVSVLCESVPEIEEVALADNI
jgi:hypothetical protein